MVEAIKTQSQTGPSRRILEERILRAAAHVFGRCGYTGATIQEVAAEAGVTKPTVYNYFKNKQALYGATLDWINGLLMDRQEAAAAGPGSIPDRILAVLKVKVQLAREWADFIRAAHSSMFAPDGARPPQDPLRQWERHFALVQRLVVEGVQQGELEGDPMDISMVISDILGTIVLAQALFPAMPILQQGIEERFWNVIYHGAKKR